MPDGKLEPKIAHLFLCDECGLGRAGKINCFGIFDIFRVWAFPVVREATVVISLYNIRKGENLSINWVAPKEKETILGTFALAKSADPYHFARFTHRFPIPIKEDGIHYLRAVIGNTEQRSPIIVKLEEWPKFSKEEIDKILKDPNSVKSAKIEVTCGKCGHTYFFETTIDPNKKNTPGTLTFPKSGKIKCKTKDCETTIHTRDLEGYARSLLGKSPSKKE